MVAEAPITTLYVSRYYRQYLYFNLVNTPQNIMAGKTEKLRAQLSKITSDRWVLRTICGYHVELFDKPGQALVSFPIKFSKFEEEAINKEILEFSNKGIVESVVQAVPDEFISNIFVGPKSDGGIRVILNLKPLNQHFVNKIHFKMEILNSAIIPCSLTIFG